MICPKCRNEFIGSPKMHKCAESEQAKLMKEALRKETERLDGLRSKCKLFDFAFSHMFLSTKMMIAALKALPPDSLVVGIFESFERGTTTLAICSEEFPIIESGAETPRGVVHGRKMPSGDFLCWHDGQPQPPEVIEDIQREVKEKELALSAEENIPQ